MYGAIGCVGMVSMVLGGFGSGFYGLGASSSPHTRESILRGICSLLHVLVSGSLLLASGFCRHVVSRVSWRSYLRVHEHVGLLQSIYGF